MAKDLRSLPPELLSTARQINYRTRIQVYRDLIARIEHTPYMVDLIAKTLVHIEVLEDNFEIAQNGVDTPLPSDLFRLGDWFEPIFKDMPAND